MNASRYFVSSVIETLLRLFPFPVKTGLMRIGNPGRNSPVFLTCNFHLTVSRVKKALKALDAYLLIANSRGINVWCAATGGLLTNHDVISVIKTSGIENLVDHRNVILPQLAASGIEAGTVRKKTGWKVVWGPVYSSDIPRFMQNDFTKSPEMREVRFPVAQRIEMAVAWAFPVSAVLALILIWFWREAIIPIVILVWGLSLLLFVTFPLYGRLLNSRKKKRVGLIFFDFGQGGLQLIIWGLFMVSLVAYSVLNKDFSWGFIIRWGFVSFIIVLILSIDLMGSTPIYKSGLHDDRLLRVALDEQKCRGASFCEQVCPRNCHSVDTDRHRANTPRADLCVQCGACVIQCPFDALFFRNSKGEMVLPETVRKFKLNLMGHRVVKEG
jgi:NAD-dependent dihydropyrimidine dehydrogenase PreA subunit